MGKPEYVVVSTSLLTRYAVPKKYKFGKPQGEVIQYCPLMFVIPLEQIETLRKSLGDTESHISPIFDSYANAYAHMLILFDMYTREDRQANFKEMVKR